MGALIDADCIRAGGSPRHGSTPASRQDEAARSLPAALAG